MPIAVHALHLKPGQDRVFAEIIQFLEKHQVQVLLYEKIAIQLREIGFDLENVAIYSQPENLKTARFLLGVGGDGTILDSVTFVKNKGIPIFGINIGRLGFLSNVHESEDIVSALENLLKKNYTIEERALLHLDSSIPCFENAPFALNECAILKTDSSSMITVHAYLNDKFLNSFWADGLIVSTPTGSTGYNLSCGGPIVLPKSGNFIITPVCPHNLNVRPLVVPDNSKISLEIESRSENFLISLDSRSVTIPSSAKLELRLEDFKVNLVKSPDNDFAQTLRAKLHWGLDNRN